MSHTVSACNQEWERVAWTGGSVPPARLRFRVYRGLRSAYFRESVREYGGLDLWTCAGTSALVRARIFWNRAGLDAWSTLRAAWGAEFFGDVPVRLEWKRATLAKRRRLGVTGASCVSTATVGGATLFVYWMRHYWPGVWHYTVKGMCSGIGLTREAAQACAERACL